MSVTKIALLVGASIVTAGSTAAAATRDKWLPKSENKETADDKDSARNSDPAPAVGIPGAKGPVQASLGNQVPGV